MRLQLLTLLAALTPSAFAYPVFSVVASQPYTAITVTWTDNGEAPKLSALSTYTLFILLGGDVDATTDTMQLTLSTKPGTFSRGSTFTGAVSPTVAGSTPDGFYIKMLANGVEGGTYTAYSERFTITGMTGTTPAEYVKAAAAGGIPTNINAIAKAAVPAPAAPAASLPVGANEYQIPYNQQSGTVRYAPMQKIPPTKITKNNPTPLFPPSAVVTAKTNLPLPTILTTVTEPQTFSVQSHANTAAAQSQPTGDMARFLARWKD